MATFTLDAWVIGGRHRHHRAHDHLGADSDLYVTLEAPVGNWGAGTPIRYVIADLYDRISRLTSYSHQIRVAHLDAYVMASTIGVEVSAGHYRTFFPLAAIARARLSHSFIMYALVVRGGTFSLNACVKGTSQFYLHAWVV